MGERVPLTSRIGVGLLVSLHVAYCAMPSLSGWLSLIPGLTFSGMIWQLLTSAFLERSTIGLLVSSAACALFGHIFEPRWGQREAIRFVVVCALASALGSCVFVMATFAATRSEGLLFVELSGFSGVVAGIAVAIHQAAHSEARGIATATPIGWLVGESRKVAMLYLLIHASWCLLTGHTVDILLAAHGLLFAWVYLRFYQPHASELDSSTVLGDASEAFAFASMFFPALQPAIDSISRATWRVVQVLVPPSLAQPRGASLEAALPQLGAGEHLPGSNPSLAEQRRARAARSLEERLAASPTLAKASSAV